MTLDDIAAVIQNGQQELPELKRITSKDMDFTTWLSDYYLLEVEQVDGGVICYADGVEAVSYTHLDVYKRQVGYGLLMM